LKITVQSGTGTSPRRETLGDDSDKVAPIDGWLPERNSEGQSAYRLRADAKKFFDRGNTTTSFPFIVDRQHASYEEALKFVRDHFLNVPRQGLVEISQTGDHAFSVFLPDALISMKVVLLKGVNTKIQYTVTGGQFQASSPNSTPTTPT
jgi:hypothetical protein